MLPNNTQKKNRVYAPIIIGLSLFLITFIVYPLYIKYIDINTEIAILNKSMQDKQKQIEAIKIIQAEFIWSWSSEIKSKVTKYNHEFDSSYIMEEVMLNKFTKWTSLTPPQVSIWTITLDKWQKLPSGLSLANVSIAVSADTPDQIIDYIMYLTNESRYAFSIDSVNIPLDTWVEAQDKKWLTLNLSFWVYYFE